jgi:hypothetical protein
MLPSRLLLAFAVLAAAPAVAAEDLAAPARAVTREVNGALATLQRAAFRSQRPYVGYASEVVAWRDASGVRKLEVTDLDDSGSVVTEYYFRDADLVFAYVAIKAWTDTREVTRNEQRFYFRRGALLRWLDGMDKVERGAADPEFARERDLLLDAAAFHREAANRAFTARNPAR